MEQQRPVIVGAGMAAARLVEELDARGSGRYAMTLIGEEPASPHNCVLLSSVLAGDASLADIRLNSDQWSRTSGVEMIKGRKVTRIDAAAQKVALDDGGLLSYGKLAFATGSRAIRLPIAGADLPGSHTFRDIRDTQTLAALGAAGARVLVIGGGFLGLEAAYGLALWGARVTLTHVMERLMERQRDARGAALLLRLVENNGVRVMLNVNSRSAACRTRAIRRWPASGPRRFGVRRRGARQYGACAYRGNCKS